MRFRKLRIAWSVVWGLACVSLIVLWVRSYGREDLRIDSQFWVADLTTVAGRKLHWLVTIFCAILVGVIWPGRFSLRALLIATTLLAAVLGLIVWTTGE